MPVRDANQERMYTGAQAGQLKRLIDCGHRPGKLLRLDETALSALDALRASILSTANPEVLDAWMRWIVSQDTAAFGRHFHRELLRLGIEAFLTDLIAPLIHRVGDAWGPSGWRRLGVLRVGDAWASGEIGIAEEHRVSQQIAKRLRAALMPTQLDQGSPRFLLTTLPGEEHTLGLLRVETLLVANGAATIQLGPQLPYLEIVRASGARSRRSATGPARCL